MTATVAGFSIQTAGVILIVAGVVGLLISLLLYVSDADRRKPREVEIHRYLDGAESWGSVIARGP